MQILVEIDVRTEKNDEHSLGMPEYTLAKTIEMPQLPTPSTWFTFGSEGRQVVRSPKHWDVDWLDERSLYRITCYFYLDPEDPDYSQVSERLEYLRLDGWADSRTKR